MKRLSFLLASALAIIGPLSAVEPVARYDHCVYAATPGGIAMAVRAAREGLSVVLVNHNDHLGGILASGLGVWDTLWEGKRSPIYGEVRQAIFEHYRMAYGEESRQYRDALPGKSEHTNGQTPSLPGAGPRSDRFRCGGRVSKFQAGTGECSRHLRHLWRAVRR